MFAVLLALLVGGGDCDIEVEGGDCGYGYCGGGYYPVPYYGYGWSNWTYYLGGIGGWFW